MTNRKYWEMRQAQVFLDGEKITLQLAKDLQQNYRKAINSIEKEINAFYGKFASETGISLSQAKKMLNKTELKSFLEQLKEYIDYGKKNSFSQAYLDKLNLLKYKTKLSRLEELKTSIQFEITKLQNTNYQEITDTLGSLYDDIFYKEVFNLNKQIGLSISFTKPNINAIEKYLTRKVNLGNFAIGKNSIWEYKIPQLTNLLNTKIPQGIILGQNPKKVAAIANKQLGIRDYNSTVRLVRTEYNYIFNQATLDSYNACGINKYQILVALDERTCDECGPLDLLIVNTSEKVVGLNCPPFHPNCRCTTIPYFEPDEFDVKSTRIAKDENNQPYMVPEDLTYTEWKAGLKEHEGGVMYFEGVKKK